MNLDRLFDVFAILFGVGGVGSLLLSIRRTKAQNALDLSSAWASFAAPLMKRLDCLEETVKDQESEISDLRGWAERLAKQVVELGGIPVPFVRRRQKVDKE